MESERKSWKPMECVRKCWKARKVRMTMHEVVHEMVVGECHEPNSDGSGSAWKTYMNARVAGLFMLVSLEYPNDVLGDDEFCQRCTCMRCGSGLSKGLCLIYGNNQNSLNDSPNGIFCHRCTCESCRKGAHYGYNCPPIVSIIHNLEHYNNQTIDELPQTLPSFDPTCYSGDGNSFTYDSKSNIIDDSPNLMEQLTSMCDMVGQYIQNKEEEKQAEEEQAAKVRYWKIPACYDDDDDDHNTIAITHKEPDNSISFHDEDIPKKIYSNPLFDEEISSIKIDLHHFNAESDLIESMLNHDSSIISSSSKIDSFFNEFTGELTLFKSIPLGIE
nr:hypothetical protein [Tanacetum cinerariifolium]